MSPSYDPRKPRKNPEVKEILRCIARTHSDLQKAPERSQQIGYARVLQAHLQMLEEEPESFTDLVQGVVESDRWLDNADLEPIVTMSGESPFQRPGKGEGRFFYRTDGGYWSNLCLGSEPVDPYQIPVMHRHGPFVHNLEKVYACPTETTHHFGDPYRLKQYLGTRRNPDRKKRFWLLSDPRGVAGGGCELVQTYAREPAAVAAADRFGSELDIRFLVATPRIAFLNR